ncbi:hypothetical protein TNCV_3241471 [Trichonephila clavipes]|nr:hypothetical protein TNCV_3241471 [Trichonephila clavipes]
MNCLTLNNIVRRGIDLVKYPRIVAPQIWSFLPNSISLLFQDINGVLQVCRLALRYPFHHDDTINIEKKEPMSVTFSLDLLIRAIFAFAMWRSSSAWIVI